MSVGSGEDIGDVVNMLVSCYAGKCGGYVLYESCGEGSGKTCGTLATGQDGSAEALDCWSTALWNFTLLGAVWTISEKVRHRIGYPVALASCMSVGISMESKNFLMSHSRVVVCIPCRAAISSSNDRSSADWRADGPLCAESLWYAMLASYCLMGLSSSCMSRRYSVVAIATVLVSPVFFGRVAMMFSSICNGGTLVRWIMIRSMLSLVSAASGAMAISAKAQWSTATAVLRLKLLAAALILSGLYLTSSLLTRVDPDPTGGPSRLRRVRLEP